MLRDTPTLHVIDNLFSCSCIKDGSDQIHLHHHLASSNRDIVRAGACGCDLSLSPSPSLRDVRGEAEVFVVD